MSCNQCKNLIKKKSLANLAGNVKKKEHSASAQKLDVLVKKDAFIPVTNSCDLVCRAQSLSSDSVNG